MIEEHPYLNHAQGKSLQNHRFVECEKREKHGFQGSHFLGFSSRCTGQMSGKNQKFEKFNI